MLQYCITFLKRRCYQIVVWIDWNDDLELKAQHSLTNLRIKFHCFEHIVQKFIENVKCFDFHKYSFNVCVPTNTAFTALLPPTTLSLKTDWTREVYLLHSLLMFAMKTQIICIPKSWAQENITKKKPMIMGVFSKTPALRHRWTFAKRK